MEEGEHSTYHERASTTSELQARYEHILKDRKKSKDISKIRHGLREDTKNTFDEISMYKKQLSSLSSGKRREEIRNRRVGKNILPKGERGMQPKYVYTEGCIKSNVSVSPEGSRKKDLDRINKELRRYY